MKLSSVTSGKNNNYNLIRILAALAVLVGHSFALLKQPEPLGQDLGISLGSIAVDLFFIASGFLVTGSLLQRQNLQEYLLARALRIFPGLLVVLLLSVFVLGAVFTSLTLTAYYSHPQTYYYLHKCLTLVTGAAYYLPGVFESNPYKGAVNGSLWTMVYEVKMYIFLAIFWAVCRVSKNHGLLLFRRLILLLATGAGIFSLVHYFSSAEHSPADGLFFMFFSGAAYAVLKDKVQLSARLFWPLCLALLGSAMLNQQAFFLVYQVSLAYILFYLAYVPAGLIRKYNVLGDYSYGVYIYAFPVQQSLIALYPAISVAVLTLLSGAVTLMLAVLSWYLIEQPALAFKGRFVARRQSASSLAAHTAPPV
ncbi:acyltransferase family protein [Undibacterium sp. Ren11W]|uniref:acyltransferase family protein n=1 Tax=Undibacterium sp. Ren11W TaxID=3413045 RepID=UPI003BF2EB4A